MHAVLDSVLAPVTEGPSTHGAKAYPLAIITSVVAAAIGIGAMLVIMWLAFATGELVQKPGALPMPAIVLSVLLSMGPLVTTGGWAVEYNQRLQRAVVMTVQLATSVAAGVVFFLLGTAIFF